MRRSGLLFLFCFLLPASGCVVVQNPNPPTIPDPKAIPNTLAPTVDKTRLAPLSDFNGPLAQAAISQHEDASPSDQTHVIDNVLVTGRSLSGYWMVEGPSSIDYSVGILSGFQITYDLTPRARNICVIHDNQGQLDAICAAGTAETAQGTRKGAEFKLIWTDSGGSLIFTGGQVTANIIDGALSGGVLGMGLTGGLPAKLFRLDAFGTPKTHALSPLMAQVIADVRGQRLSEPRYDPKGLSRFKSGLTIDAYPTGNLHLTWLGTIYNRWRPKQPEAAEEVFRVESDDRTSLCRLAVTPEGLVHDFNCRAARL